MFSVGQLAKDYQISRTTLLYYDSIGLLKPTGRTSAGYRQYTPEDRERLEIIVAYRKTGLSLQMIADMIKTTNAGAASILFKRLGEINAEISALRRQQEFIIQVLKSKSLPETDPDMDAEAWKEILRGAGITMENAKAWHRAFEHSSPDQHHAFLVAFGFSKEAIQSVVDWIQTKDDDENSR